MQAAPGAVGPDATEGIVPGQDFCNHGMFPNSRWTISGGPGSQVSFHGCHGFLPFLAPQSLLALPVLSAVSGGPGFEVTAACNSNFFLSGAGGCFTLHSPPRILGTIDFLASTSLHQYGKGRQCMYHSCEAELQACKAELQADKGNKLL